MSSKQVALKDFSENAEIVRNAWNNLVLSKRIEKQLLRNEIALSWERCLQRNVCPLSSTTSIDTIVEYFSDSDLILKFIAEPYMRSVHEHLKDQGFIVVLTNAEGKILHLVGDRDMRGEAEKLSVVPGASFLENVLGTTSPGICIEKRIPIQVSMYEHFCKLFHSWCCTAAPIFDQSGNFVGSLDVSNMDKMRHHAYLLDYVAMTARTIGLELSYRMLQGDLNKQPLYFHAAGHDRHGAVDSCVTINPDDRKFGAPLRSRAHVCETLREPDAAAARNANFQCAAKDGSALIRYDFDSFIHGCAAMKDVIAEARRLSGGDMNIFISGESGTGKEILAQAIHDASSRRNRPFVAVNCAGMPKELIQSELFGYVEGAFTGARRKGQPGKFELADGGTLFLDEVGDMPLDAQANLLRVLQERYVVRLGCSRPVPVDVRVISATNKDLAAEIAEGRFRNDLYYRLVVIDLDIPPLRERDKDLWLLIDHFSRNAAPGRPRCAALTFSPDAREMLENYDWPGNVRELENAVLSMQARTRDGIVRAEHLPKSILQSCGKKDALCINGNKNRKIMDALEANNFNLSKAAKLLGMSRSTLYRRMKKDFHVEQ